MDAVTGEALSTATIQVEGTYRGTIANAEGRFELLMDALPAVVIVRHIGYSMQRVEYQQLPESEPIIKLEPALITLQELVVTDEDPAIRIMREVIERKKQWRNAMRSSEAVAYSRYTVSNDTGIVIIRESVSEAYWDHERGWREVVIGSKQTENADMPLAVPAATSTVNLLDNNVQVFGYEFIGVTHPDALSHYHYRLVGTLLADDTVIYKIAVLPRNRFISAFKGTVFVHGDEYGLLEAELEPSETMYLPMPIRSFKTVFKQQFSTFGGPYWLPVDYRSEATLDLRVSLLLKIPTIKVAQVSRFADYVINADVPEDVYADDNIVQVDTVAVETDSILARDGVAVPLLPEERLAYSQIDSTLDLVEAFEPRGPASFLWRAMADLGSSLVQGSDDAGFLPSWLTVSPRLWFNSVDALYGGANVRIDATGGLDFQGRLGRSTGLRGDEAWHYKALGRLETGENRVLGVDASYGAGSKPRYNSKHMNRWRSSMAMLIGRGDYHDHYRSSGISVGIDVSGHSGKVRARSVFVAEHHSPLQRTTNYDFAGNKDVQRLNVPIGPARHQALSLIIGLGGKPLIGGVGAISFLEVDVEHSLPGSDYEYTRFNLVAEWRQETLLQRRLLPAMLHLRLEVATSGGVLPLQRMHIVEGGGSRSRSFGLLHSHAGYPFEGDAVMALFWDHNFRSLPFELLSLRWFARRGYGIAVFGGHARTWTPQGLTGTDGYHEIGVGLTGILGLFRLNLAKHLSGGLAVTYGFIQIY